MEKINKYLTLDPVTTDSGVVVTNVGMAKIPNTDKWIKGKLKFCWLVSLRKVDEPGYSYYAFGYNDEFINKSGKMPDYLKPIKK